MRYLELLLVVANTLTFCLLTAPLPRRVWWLRRVALAAVLVAFAQIALQGARWQMAPAYMLTGLLLLFWLLPHKARNRGTAGRKRTGRLAAGVTTGLGVFGLAVSIGLPMALPVFQFLRPAGPYEIGAVTYHWVDAGRSEAFSPEPTARRELMAQIWYPAMADPSAPRAPYVQDVSVLAPLAHLLGLPALTFEHWKYVTTNAIPSAAASTAQPSYPVLIFLEGMTGYRQMNTFQVEALVSQGYIVVAIDQPYVAASVTFPDGRQVSGHSKRRMNALIQQSIDPIERSPILQGLSFKEGIIPYLAQDVSFALNELTVLNRADPNSILTGRLDLQRVGVFGVSLGGIVVAEACKAELRLRACLVMDAPMPADVVQAGLRQPSMWITRDADTMRREGWSPTDVAQHQATMRAVFRRVQRDGYFVSVRGMFHANLTDAPYWSPLFSLMGVTGPVGDRRAHRIVNAYTLAFFDRHLKGRRVVLLEGSADHHPEVSFERLRP